MAQTSPSILAAERFLHSSARLLERLRFAHRFGGEQAGSRERVLSALHSYQNPDGGFGQGLEPDFRGPVSQPLCIDQAFRVWDELARWPAPEVTRALDYLCSIAAADGGVPNVLANALDYERAPWWRPDPQQPGSLLPTASLVGLLYKHKIEHPFRDAATRFCWQALEALTARIADSHERLPLMQALYEARATLLFLQHVPEPARAERAVRTLGQALHDKGVFVHAAETELSTPLEFASEPASPARAWFDDATIAAALDTLRHSQQHDGGFVITWAAWHPLAALEWRGIVTLERLNTLRAYGMLA
jgi:hypothetical protein